MTMSIGNPGMKVGKVTVKSRDKGRGAVLPLLQ